MAHPITEPAAAFRPAPKFVAAQTMDKSYACAGSTMADAALLARARPFVLEWMARTEVKAEPRAFGRWVSRPARNARPGELTISRPPRRFAQGVTHVVRGANLFASRPTSPALLPRLCPAPADACLSPPMAPVWPTPAAENRLAKRHGCRQSLAALGAKAGWTRCACPRGPWRRLELPAGYRLAPSVKKGAP